MEELKSRIRHVPDFPKAGILFYDITTLLQDPAGLRLAVDSLTAPFVGHNIELVVGVESRGFIFGSVVADRLGAGFSPVRKPGKLPSATMKASYSLEYGSDCLEIHADAVSRGQRVLIVDDLLATGGTARATSQLVKQLGGEVFALAFLIELVALNGRQQLEGERIHAVVKSSAPVLLLLSALIVSAAIAWAGATIGRHLAAARDERVRGRSLQLMTLFAPGIASAADDSRALLVWQPLAAAARKLFPASFESLDQANGGTFPFTAAQIEAAHARWSTDWLGWEQTHDAEYKLKAAQIEAAIAAGEASPLGRAKLDAVEREKLELYQRRYAEYVRVSKALKLLTQAAPGSRP